MTNVTSLAAVRAMLADAEAVADVRNAPRPPAGIDPGGWLPNALGLPDDCPVIPLGISGSTGWFLDPIGQVQSFSPPYGKGHLLGLFAGNASYLTWAWPRFGKSGVDGYAAERAAAALLSACAAKGPWESIDKIRGRGCWTDAGGNLVVHTGTAVIAGKTVMPPGEIDGHVYPTRARLPGPLSLRDELPFNPAHLLRPLLRSWSWQRPDIDHHLMLGWIANGFLGAALPWRAMVFVTGDKGTGKSVLQSLVKAVFGDWLIQAADTTAAGLYQHVGLDSIPIAVDELESESNVAKQKAVMKLARLASSGAAMLRGGDRHQGVEFNARSAFMLSSINAPPLEPQDLSRMGLLRLNKLKPGGKPPQIDRRTFEIVGRCILRRLIEEWPRFHETFDAFAGELAAGGLDGRGQAQFGTLLTCADMIEFSGWDDERLAHACDVAGDVVRWRDLLAADGLHELEDATENWRGCLNHLLSVRVDAWRAGRRQTVGQLLEAYHRREETDIISVNNDLAQAGLKVVFKQDGSGRPRPLLAIPNQGPLVRQLYDGSKWAGELGASVWAPALRQASQDGLWQAGRWRINGVLQRTTDISLAALYGEGGIMGPDVEE